MRIFLRITAENLSLTFNHQQKLVGCIHKWIGKNDLHGNISLYSFSQLNGGRKHNGDLFFENGANMFISSYDNSVIKQIISGVKEQPEMFLGFRVNEILIQQEPDLSNRNRFLLASPALIKRTIDKKTEYFFYDDEISSKYLTETIKSKMKKVGLEDDTLSIKFDKEYKNAKTKLINYNGVKNPASMCPILINANPTTKQFIWNVGVGSSTGIGFGAIK